MSEGVPSEPASPKFDRHDIDGFIKAVRTDLRGYAAALARGDLASADDAVAHAEEQCWKHFITFAAICPSDRDPVAWMKTVIARRVIDSHRRRRVSLRNLSKLVLPSPPDPAELALDNVVAEQARTFMKTLRHKDHVIATLRWEGDLEPKVIADILCIPASTVPTALPLVAWRPDLERRLGRGSGEAQVRAGVPGRSCAHREGDR